MLRRVPPFLARLIGVFALGGGVVGVSGIALSLGVSLPLGEWETPLRLLLQEHSLILLAVCLPGLVFGALLCRLRPRPWGAWLALGLGIVGVLWALLPLGQAMVAGQVFDRRMREALGEDYRLVSETAGVRLRPHLVNLRDWLNIPTTSGADIHAVTLEYRSVSGQRLMLDLYRPSSGEADSRILVLIHGGGLTGGARSDMRLLAEDFASRGYVVASVDYRLAPGARIPEAVDDVLCAVGWLRENVAGGQARTWLGLLGFSSGGHLALLAGYWSMAGSVPVECPGADIAIQAVVALAPVTDLSFYDSSDLGYDPMVAGAGAPLTSPLELAESGASSPPILIVHGRRDDVVDVSSSEAFLEAASLSRRAVVLLDPAWSGHAFQALPGGLGSQVSLFFVDRFLAWTQIQPWD